jgi:hypothetical protein
VCIPSSSGSLDRLEKERLAKLETGSGGATRVNVQEEIYALQNLKSVDATEVEWPTTRTLSPGRAHFPKKSLIESSNPDGERQLQGLCPREVPPM